MRNVATFIGVLASSFALGACNRADQAERVTSTAVEVRHGRADRSSTIAGGRTEPLVPDRIVDAGAATRAIVSPAPPDVATVARVPPPRSRRTARHGPASGESATNPAAEAPLEEPAGTEMVCARISQGVRVDPEDEAPCEWVRRPSCPGMFVVWHHDGRRLFGTCATTMPP